MKKRILNWLFRKDYIFRQVTPEGFIVKVYKDKTPMRMAHFKFRVELSVKGAKDPNSRYNIANEDDALKLAQRLCNNTYKDVAPAHPTMIIAK